MRGTAIVGYRDHECKVPIVKTWSSEGSVKVGSQKTETRVQRGDSVVVTRHWSPRYQEVGVVADFKAFDDSKVDVVWVKFKTFKKIPHDNQWVFPSICPPLEERGFYLGHYSDCFEAITPEEELNE